jgi:Beta-galactosidase trimerisation domain
MRPWFSKFSGVLHDPRWLPVVESIFQWHESAGAYMRHETPLARVAIVYSQQTAWFYGGDQATEKVENYTLGWYQALIEARVPFEMVHDRLLDPAHIAQFKTLILPNIAALSDAQCDALRAFVQNGGSIIATYETSLYDEWGVRRKDFGLADLFGVSWKVSGEGPMQNSYLRLEHDSAPGNPLFKGLEDAPRIINGVWRLDVQPRAQFAPPPLTLIPSYPDLPMEKVYPRVAQTNVAGVYLREAPSASSGRVAYFPWDIDRTFWEVLALDHYKIIHNTIEWVTNEPQMVDVTGPGVLDVTSWRNRDSIVIHLVNLTNPMMMKGPFRNFVPVGEQSVRVRLPSGVTAKNIHLLVGKQTPQIQSRGVNLTVTVPSILDHEVVAIDI